MTPRAYFVIDSPYSTLEDTPDNLWLAHEPNSYLIAIDFLPKVGDQVDMKNVQGDDGGLYNIRGIVVAVRHSINATGCLVEPYREFETFIFIESIR